VKYLGPVSAAAERFASGPPPKVSFEFFPPKTEAMEEKLWAAIERLAPLEPTFVSVTYGAGGSTRERTHRIVTRIGRETGLSAAAHLTCVAASRAEVDEVAQSYWDEGVRHIVALRGDPPEGAGANYQPHPDGYAYASDLVAGLKKIGDFEISVAVYPERHPESGDWDAEIDNLKRKVDAGADRGITQFFFDPDVFLRFVERARKAGVEIPLVPGIMPVTNVKSLLRMASMCGTQTPQWLVDLFDGLDNDPGTRQLVASAVATEQCARLYQEGFDAFHFYTLNRAELTLAICRVLGVRSSAAARV
jgi:methylenetetrahydrofolate reductase (NADPH)